MQGIASEDTKGRVERQLLEDFRCLLGCRWNMIIEIKTHNGKLYAFGNNSRFNVSDKTISNALGDLTNHVEFLKSASGIEFEYLADYKTCKEKWNVPDVVSEGSYGWDRPEQGETSLQIKRKRF